MKLRFFVPGKLENPSNRPWHWAKRYRWSKEWRDKTRSAFMLSYPASLYLVGAQRLAKKPKKVTFMAFIAKPMDDDGLSASLKPVRDELTAGNHKRAGLGIISGDGPFDGHRFIYEQVQGTRLRGVDVTVEDQA